MLRLFQGSGKVSCSMIEERPMIPPNKLFSQNKFKEHNISKKPEWMINWDSKSLQSYKYHCKSENLLQ